MWGAVVTRAAANTSAPHFREADQVELGCDCYANPDACAATLINSSILLACVKKLFIYFSRSLPVARANKQKCWSCDTSRERPHSILTLTTKSSLINQQTPVPDINNEL